MARMFGGGAITTSLTITAVITAGSEAAISPNATVTTLLAYGERAASGSPQSESRKGATFIGGDGDGASISSWREGARKYPRRSEMVHFEIRGRGGG